MKSKPTTTDPVRLELLVGPDDDLESAKPEVYVPSGIKAIDDLILGAIAGEMLLIGGKPGDGKTSLAMQWVLTAAQNGLKAGVLSLEMKKRALRNRLISGLTGIPIKMIRTHEWESPTHKRRAVEARDYLGTLPIYVDDRGGLDGDQAYKTILSWKEAGIGLVVVDYIQHMSGTNESRVTQVGDATRAIKAAAKDADLPVIAISSLNRSGDGKPSLKQLRDSGDLEFVADTVLMPHYPDGDDEYAEVRLVDIYVLKQRNGPTGVASVRFNKPATRFEDL